MGDVIKQLCERGLIEGTTSEELSDFLISPRKVYIGFDPTADSLHLGNMMGIIVAKWFEKCGHTPVLLLGGATARIGDPSGKDMERPLLALDQIDANVASIVRLFHRFFENPIVVNNLDWLGKFSMIDFLRDVGKQFRMGPMLSKESVKRRLESDEGMSFTEFTYQMMQGYDFYHLYKDAQVEMQLGGSDQWGNIVAGVEYTRRMTGKPVHGLTFPLLTRSDGKKFGKSESGAIWLTEDKTSAYDMYQYLFRMSDADVVMMLKRLTFLDIKEIEAIERFMEEEGYRANSAQERLAEEVTRFVHGDEGLAKAKTMTEAAKPGGQISLDVQTLEALGSDFPTAELEREMVCGHRFIDLCVTIGLSKSKSEATRLVNNNGAYLNNERVIEVNKVIKREDLVGDKYLVFGSGKKKKMLVRIKKP